MARQPRLCVPGHAHLVVVRGHNGTAIVRDEVDAGELLGALRDATGAAGIPLLAYGLTADELRLVLRPEGDAEIGRMMQALGRRYVARFNRRHRRSGSLWDGRYRSAVVQPGEPLLCVLRWVDAGLSARSDADGSGESSLPEAGHQESFAQGSDRTSARHRLGVARDPALVDPAEFWQLGNTPFERESRYRRLLAEPLPKHWAHQIGRSQGGAGVIGDGEFLRQLAEFSGRPLTPRRRGRPKRAP